MVRGSLFADADRSLVFVFSASFALFSPRFDQARLKYGRTAIAWRVSNADYRPRLVRTVYVGYAAVFTILTDFRESSPS